MVARRCGHEVPARKGRGRPRTEWCGDECKAAHLKTVYEAGARVVRKASGRGARIVHLERMTAAERRIELGRAAQRMGVL